MTAICRKSDGRIVGTYEYDLWGKPVSVNATSYDTQGITNRNPIRYRSYYYDTETGLYYLNARYYDAGIRRFLSADSIAFVGGKNDNGYNLYAYCLNDPINAQDPSGCSPTGVSYYFYNAVSDKRFLSQARKHRKSIAKELGYESIDSVIMIPITEKTKFIDDWNNIGIIGEHDVSVDLVFINTHGDYDGILVGKNNGESENYFMQKDIDRLTNKSIGGAVLFTCSSGATIGTFAADFASKINGATVLAGSNAIHSIPIPFFGYKCDGDGYVIFTDKDNQIERQLVNQHWMTVGEMLEELGY